jgi:hypothetical protein
MVTDGERRLIYWLVKLRIWKMQSDGLWNRPVFRPMWGTGWLLRVIMRRQASDGLHHAPACPANNWTMQALVFQRCTCGAARFKQRDVPVI